MTAKTTFGCVPVGYYFTAWADHISNHTSPALRRYRKHDSRTAQEYNPDGTLGINVAVDSSDEVFDASASLGETNIRGDMVSLVVDVITGMVKPRAVKPLTPDELLSEPSAEEVNQVIEAVNGALKAAMKRSGALPLEIDTVVFGDDKRVRDRAEKFIAEAGWEIRRHVHTNRVYFHRRQVRGH